MIAYIRTQLNIWRTEVYRWTGLTAGEVGQSVRIPRSADKCVHIRGNFSGGASVSIKGTNDDGDTNYVILKDYLGEFITATAAGIYQLVPSPLNLRPEVSGGDGSTSIVVTIVSRTF